jgi:hypothetical protein
MDAAGDFVVVWSSDGGEDGDDYGVFAQRFDSAGVAQAFEFQVNLQTLNRQRRPAVAINSAGDFVVTWVDELTAGGDVMARRWSSAGTPVGGELRVNVYTVGYQGLPGVGVDSIGNFAVAWQSYLQDGDSFGIFGRRLNAFGAGQPFDFPVNLYATGSQGSPQVSMDAGGDFVVTWVDASLDGGGAGVFGLAFDELGVPHGGVFQASTYTTGNQQFPDVALDADGDFVVVWGSPLQDGDGFGVFARRFGSAAKSTSIDVDGNGVAAPLTDGLLVLRYLFGFRGSTLIAGAVAGDCTRCTAPQIEAFLAALEP